MAEADDREPAPSDSDKPAAYDPERARTEKSLGVGGETHWLQTRKDLHEEEIEFLRERSRAPGVAEGGAERNQYCLECGGVIPLEYDSRESAARAPTERCPHCGVEVDPSVRRMFNWVEIDQAPNSDLRALLPFLIGGTALLIALGVGAWWIFSD